EAEGNPFFISELVRFKRTLRSRALPGGLTDVLCARISQLEASAREVLELLAIAASPLEQEVVALAARLPPAQFADVAAVLRGAPFARAAGCARRVPPRAVPPPPRRCRVVAARSRAPPCAASPPRDRTGAHRIACQPRATRGALD